MTYFTKVIAIPGKQKVNHINIVSLPVGVSRTSVEIQPAGVACDIFAHRIHTGEEHKSLHTRDLEHIKNVWLVLYSDISFRN